MGEHPISTSSASLGRDRLFPASNMECRAGRWFSVATSGEVEAEAEAEADADTDAGAETDTVEVDVEVVVVGDDCR